MQIGLTAFVVALAASWSEEKSRGTDDATVRASPRKVGRRWLTISNSRQSKLVLNACGSATGHATNDHTRAMRVSICLFPAWRSGEAREPALQLLCESCLYRQ
jgi:hypothetical protein